MATSLIHSDLKTASPASMYAPSLGPRPQNVSATEGQALRVSAYHSWAQLENQIPAWEAILRSNASLSIFSTPEWLGSWWKAFGANKRTITLMFSSEDNAVVGLIPFYVDELRSPLLGKLAHLRLIGDGSGDSDNLDMIVRPGYEEACARALVRWLANQPDWDVCSLDTLPDDSLTAAALMRGLRKVSWTCVAENSPNSAILLPKSWLQYVESLPPSFRPLVTRYLRRLAQRHQVKISRSEDPDDLATRLEILFTLHEKRWNLVNQSGSFCSRERREFYLHMARSFLRRGWLEFWLLELDGVPAATQYCFRYRDTVYILQEGFDPQFAADKAGYALRAAMLKHFIESGVKRYDFLGGLAAHKQNWGAKPGAYLNLRFARPGSIGSLYLSCTSAMTKSKEWLRANLPACAWDVLHWLKMRLADVSAEPDLA